MNDLGPQYKQDNGFAAKARLLQSRYRAENDWEFGNGPHKTSTNKYGNIILDGEVNGRNFILPETFIYAKQRVKNKRKVETIGSYRLFCNMLSSMPMCFNLFHPLMICKDKEEVNLIFQKLFPLLAIDTIDEIKLEYIPEPIVDYINDKSAFDAFVSYTNRDNEKGIIAIETKYVEPLGKNIGSDNKLKVEVAQKSKLFTPEGIRTIEEGCTQVYRNFLLTEAYREINHYQHSHSIILSPLGNTSSHHEIEDVQQKLKPEHQAKIAFYSLEDFVSIIQNHTSMQKWIKSFQSRYLKF